MKRQKLTSRRKTVLKEEHGEYRVNGNAGTPHLRFIDLFCGIGGFRFAMEAVAEAHGHRTKCVFSSDIDPCCQRAYEANFGESPVGDITKVHADDVPDHDVLPAGFPCRPFSIVGHMRSLEDTRGIMLFDIDYYAYYGD